MFTSGEKYIYRPENFFFGNIQTYFTVSWFVKFYYASPKFQVNQLRIEENGVKK